MSRGSEFMKNTFILLLGKFSTQFTSFLLIPLFTHYLSSDDYGWVDLLQTYITLFVPVLTLRMDSALFRFLIDKRDNEKEKSNVISNVLFLTVCGLIVAIIFAIILYYIFSIKYFILTVINLIVMMLSSVLLQILRGLGKNKEYSIASCIAGFLALFINIVLIIGFKYGADSILISASISNLVVIIYIINKSKICRYIRKKMINKRMMRDLLKYSLPMIPNSLSWWTVNASDRTLITIFLGNSINGIYSISCKFSNLLNSVYSIFNMSWQETASIHINDEDRDDFFSNMIIKIFMLFACISLLINSALPIVYNVVIGNEYISSYNYIPILLYANCWNIMISLLGGIYIALKRTKEIASTTIMSALINLVVNICTIKFIGLYAATISTLIAYFSMAIYRYFDCKKYVKLKIDKKEIPIFTLVFLFSMILYYINNFYLNIINIIFAILYSFHVNKEIIYILKDKIKDKIIFRKKKY